MNFIVVGCGRVGAEGRPERRVRSPIYGTAGQQNESWPSRVPRRAAAADPGHRQARARQSWLGCIEGTPGAVASIADAFRGRDARRRSAGSICAHLRGTRNAGCGPSCTATALVSPSTIEARWNELNGIFSRSA